MKYYLQALKVNQNYKSIDKNNLLSGIVMLNNPDIGDQGSQGYCVGWSIGYAAMGILSYSKFNNDWILAKEVQVTFLIK